jgi:hypothetical protein
MTYKPKAAWVERWRQDMVTTFLLSGYDERKDICEAMQVSRNHAMKLAKQRAECLPVYLDKGFHIVELDKQRRLFYIKELVDAIGMKGSTFHYWITNAGVTKYRTTDSIPLLKTTRSIFGTRNTFGLLSAGDLVIVLEIMMESRSHRISRKIVHDLIDLAKSQIQNG